MSLICFIIGYAFSQTPEFNNTINISQNFTNDSYIFPFNGQNLYGVGVSGNISFNSDSSLIRVIICNNTGLEYMIYETYPMLDTIWNFSFNEECEETCFLDDYIAASLIIQIVDASVYISQLKWSGSPAENSRELQRMSKENADLKKIDKLNTFIANNHMLWKAGWNSYANSFYNQKTKILGNKYSSYGFEYYSGGIFSIYGKNYIYDPTYEIVDHFDWREKHDAHKIGSNYFDGNPDEYETGNGWMTAAKCQSGCWNPLTLDYQCPDVQGNCPEGYNFEGTGNCTGFTGVGMVEALMNIYFNQHINLDLSEMELSAQEDIQLPRPCLTVCDGSEVKKVLEYITTYGIIDEISFPYIPIGWPEPCHACNLQNPPNEIINIQGKQAVNSLNAKLLKKNLIQYGPLGWSDFYFSNFPDHAMVFVGFGTIYEGMEIYGLNYIIPPGDDYIGNTYWIFKNSGGPHWGNNGYVYMMLTEYPGTESYRIETPINSQINTFNRLCYDKDNDGFYNWGIGDPPSGCFGEMDGNDNNPSLGPMDENGICRIIDSYFFSFEEDLNGWRQCNDDDRDWIRHNANTPYPNIGNLASNAIDGNYYILINSAKLPINGIAILESPIIDFHDICNYEMNFWYHRPNDWGYNTSAIGVKASNDGGETWFTVWSQLGNQPDIGWNEITLTLPSNINKLRLFAQTDSYLASSNFAFDAVAINKIENQGPLIIEDYMKFTSDYHSCNDIIIKPNAQLIIEPNCTLFMPQNKKIIVERKGWLIIKGGTITCEDGGFWSGIEVWGENGQPSDLSHQGQVVINSGGTIERADIGIRTIAFINDVTNPDYSGGLIRIDDANFINNKTSIVFHPYGPYQSISYIKSCKFEMNDEFPASAVITNFISLKNIDGVQFINISVNDKRTTLPINQKSTGIYSQDSRFLVWAECLSGNPCAEWANSKFMNLKYGIYAIRSFSNVPFQVERADFVNNLRGIYASGADLLSVTLSSFATNNLSVAATENYGLYLDNCTGYEIEENYFYNYSDKKQGIGLIVNQSGDENNLIYNNTFENLSVAALAQNENRSKNGLTGLQFKCNQFLLNANDLAVTNKTPIVTKKTGIVANQGSNLNAPDAPAGNRFSHTGPTNSPTDMNNQAQHFTYYYHKNTPYDSKLRPLYFTSFTVTPVENLNNNAYWDPDESCPSHLSGGGGTGNGNGNRDEMIWSGLKADSVRNIIAVFEDGGNTIELKHEVDWSTPPESIEVYNQLINKSPYLTDTVIIAAIEKENVLANAMIRDIMVANPQSAKDDELMEKLVDRNNPVPDYMIGQILLGRNLVSVYEELQSKLTYYSQKRAYSYRKLAYEYLSNTLDPQASADSLIQLFAGEHSLKARYSLALLHNHMGDYNTGLFVLNQIPAHFELTEEQQAEHEILVEYFNLLPSLYDVVPDSTVIQQLFEIEEQETGIAAVYARNVLLALNEISYEEPIILPDMLKSSKEVRYERLMETIQESKYLKVFPNPSKDHIIVSWKLHAEPVNTKIIISNNAGESVSEWRIEEMENQQVFDTRNLKPGVYITTLYGNNKQLESVKFTIIK